MSRSHLLSIFAFLVASITTIPTNGAQSLPSPKITVDRNVVVVSSLSPGGKAVLLGVSLSSAQGRIVIQRDAKLLEDVGKTGTIRYEPGHELSRSIWVAVDCTTRQSVVGAPPGYPVRITVLDQSKLKGNGQNEFDSLVDARKQLLIYVVGAKGGVWSV